jgi:hypothetical protein
VALSVPAFNADRRLEIPELFRSSDFGPLEVFGNESDTLLVQPLIFGGEPLGILSAVLGGMEGGVYEQMRETLSSGFRGLSLSTGA